ncbi:GtrA family protein [Kibdelosporangium aridum]|uniref:Glycosyltransferase involved in cell wall bisynthesis n=1 Tax=Kibdelosporangium aridum TaxID=2030 RepID=A0A1Y5XWQ5_KIBAR|nr:GtrA family protein [Kibdelosporangium aridum]SMD20574.1 Glycosyltransferase involved in cell wall bisynthesis [Kibdelosporangium aridum]
MQNNTKNISKVDPGIKPLDIRPAWKSQPPEISVIIPARTKTDNLATVFRQLSEEHSGPSMEILLVDDSDDGAGDVVLSLAALSPVPMRLIHRGPGERHGGFGGAVLAGLAQARGMWAVVMDGDLRHPPVLAPRLAEIGRSRDVDVVIATSRHLVSVLSTAVAKAAFPRRLGQPSDPLSGFFAVRRAALDLDRLRSAGFKILMEILVRHPGLRTVEVPFPTQPRQAGRRKASLREGMTFVRHLVRLRTSLSNRRAISSPKKWLVHAGAFGLVGLSGLLVNTAVLWLLHDHLLDLPYLLAAALATEASTTWLFVLTETLVYRRVKPGTTASRAVRFFLLNHALLALRLPILALLVDGLGLGVLLSNAITLGLLFSVRLVATDSAIYRRAQPVAGESAREAIRVVVDVASSASASTGVTLKRSSDLARYLPYRYCVPNVATIGSQVRLAELDYFRAQWLDNNTEIQIRVGPVGSRRPLPRAVITQFTCPPAIEYAEHLGRFGANFQISLGEKIEVVVSPSLGRSPHVVYTNILEALLRFVTVSRGAMLLHSACLELDGVGVLISARTDTGKTGTVLRLVREHSAKFLSDDMIVLHGDGRVDCFPKPLTISHHTLRAVRSDELTRREWRRLWLQSLLHSRQGRQLGLSLSHLNVPIMGTNALTQRIVPPPKYALDRLMPCQIVPETKLAELFVIERGAHAVGDMSPRDAMSALLTNTEDAYQFPPFHQLAPSIVIGEDDHLALREKEREILAAALRRIRARSLATPDFSWADEIPRLLVPRPTDDWFSPRRYA